MVSLLSIFCDIFESVKLGAIQLTLIFGENSAAKLCVKPSIAPFEDETIEMATVAGMNMDAKKLTDTNTVKVLLDRERFAVNFRRDPIESEAGGYYHHMGIYAYRKSVLDKFTSLEPSENEIKFQLEQYRALDNGIRIKVVLTEKVNKGIDTMDDLKEYLGK